MKKATKKATKSPSPGVKKIDTKDVKMVSYSIKMVIPTGEYANIQPEIIVKAGDVETAHAFIAPHMNKLWKEYYMVSERAPEAKKATPTVDTTPNTPKMAAEAPVKPVERVIPPAPASSVAMNKATQAIASCTSIEALQLIADQIKKSVKLTNEDKISLEPIVAKKRNDLTN